MKILDRPSVILPDSTTTFLSLREGEMQESEVASEAIASAEAAQAVASLQVSTDMDQFGDLFSGVTSCTSEPNFTLIDSYSQ